MVDGEVFISFNCVNNYLNYYLNHAKLPYRKPIRILAPKPLRAGSIYIYIYINIGLTWLYILVSKEVTCVQKKFERLLMRLFTACHQLEFDGTS